MSLRIVTWNCHKALHDKYERLLALEPGIAVVPECAEPDTLRRLAPGFSFSDCEWRGTDPDKGLGVFAFGDLRLRLHQSWERRFHIFLPVEVRGPTLTVNLLAVWAFDDGDPPKVTSNPRSSEAAVAHYAPFLQTAPAVVAGDLNAGVRWDGGSGRASFAALDARLQGLGLTSAYHAKLGHRFGQEADPTLFWQWKEEQPYHIDYVYLPNAWLPCVRSVTVGTATERLAPRVSDHMPIVVECDLPPRAALQSLAGFPADALPLTVRA